MSRNQRNTHIIKWLGGKSGLVSDVAEMIVKVPFKRYVDLFAGSMAIPLTLGMDDF